MTNKTRIRVARIAAGAVIAAGASFTAAGIASADRRANVLGVCAGTPSPDPEPTTPDPTGLPTDPEPTIPDPEPTLPDPEPTLPDPEPTTANPEPSEPEEPSTEPSEPTEEDPTATPTDDPTDGSGTGNGGGDGTDGGNSNTDPDGGSNTSVQEEGSSALTDTGSEHLGPGFGRRARRDRCRRDRLPDHRCRHDDRRRCRASVSSRASWVAAAAQQPSNAAAVPGRTR